MLCYAVWLIPFHYQPLPFSPDAAAKISDRGAAVAEIQCAAPVKRANRRKTIGDYYWARQIEIASASASLAILQYFKTAFAASLPIQAAFCPEDRNIDRSASNRRTATTERAL